MDDVKAMLEAFQKRMDNKFQRVLDNMHRQCDQLQQSVVLQFRDLHERLDAISADIKTDSAIFQEMIQGSTDNSFSRPPQSMSAPPMMQHEQEQIWINDSNAIIDSRSLVPKQPEQEQLVQERLIQEMERSDSYNELMPRIPPPDLPSFLINERIVNLDMPLMPTVMEFVIPDLMHLQWIDLKQQLYIYINSPGTTRDDGEIDRMKCEDFAIFYVMIETFGEVRPILISMVILVFDPGGGVLERDTDRQKEHSRWNQKQGICCSSEKNREEAFTTSNNIYRQSMRSIVKSKERLCNKRRGTVFFVKNKRRGCRFKRGRLCNNRRASCHYQISHHNNPTAMAKVNPTATAITKYHDYIQQHVEAP